MAKFLIIRFSSIGDIVLTTPVIRCLKQQVPDAEVHYLTKSTFKGILENNPFIDKFWLWENEKDIVSFLKKEKFDFVIDLHNNLRTSILKWKLNVPAFSFKKLNIEKYLFVRFRMNVLPHIHIVDRYLQTLDFFKVENDKKGLDYFLSTDEEKYGLKIENQYIALVVGALKGTKKLPLDKQIALCNKLNKPIVLLGGKAEIEDGKTIAASSKNVILNLCGEITLGESAAIVKNAQAVVTHDTGLMHIAAAFNKPIISIWGNTVPEFGMSPYMPNSSNLNYFSEVKDLKCRPCSKIGFEACPQKHFSCMQAQDLNKIAELIKEI
jgi:ADP-heptose:LPS heptosyltransferase